MTLASLVAATDAIGLDLVCQTYPAHRSGLRDSGQLRIAQALAALRDSGWRMTLEERAGDRGEAIDQVFWGLHEILAVEIERTIADWQAQYRRASHKRDWLASQVDRPVRLVLVVADTDRNRAALAPFMPIVGSTLPAGTRAVFRAIEDGTVLGRDALCWFRQARSGLRRERAAG